MDQKLKRVICTTGYTLANAGDLQALAIRGDQRPHRAAVITELAN